MPCLRFRGFSDFLFWPFGVQMESLRFEYEAKLQKKDVEKVDEHRHLQETIEQLRDELESKHG